MAIVKSFVLLLLSFWLLACDGKDGERGPPGRAGPPNELFITIIEASVASAPTVAFRVKDENGNPVTDIDVADLRFTVSKLIPEEAANGTNAWQSYVNRVEDVQNCVDDPPPGGDCGPGADTNPPATAIQATRDQGGELEDNDNGTYLYTFTTDITDVTSPIAVDYDASATHRIGLQTRGALPPANATYDFVPATGDTDDVEMREIVLTKTCNSCHRGLEAHDERFESKYCATCHNPGTVDANSGNSMDYRVLIHKLHSGVDLPSVGDGGEYAVWGFRDTKHDYSDLVYPQDIRACATCHVEDPDAPQAGNWESNPTIAACGSCHDDIDFSVNGNVTPGGHSGGIVDDSTDCLFCHQDGRIGRGTAEAHEILERTAAERFRFNLVSVTTAGPNQNPTVRFTVTDPTNNDARYDILNDPEFTAPNGVSRLAVLIGWDSRDLAGGNLEVEFDNAGSQASAPGQPISINALTTATDPGNDDIFQVISPTPIPNLTGTDLTGVVSIEGHPAAQDRDGDYALRVPVPSLIETFAIAGTKQERRQVVSTEKCNSCHYALSLHGANRNLADEIMCVICHQPNATDAFARPSLWRTGPPDRSGDPATITADGKREESIDMKTMIHAIHAGAQTDHGSRENGLVVWGYPGYRQVFGPPCDTNQCEHDYSHVRYPGMLSDCEACHLEGTYELEDTWELPTQNGVLANKIDTHPTANDAASLDTQIADPSDDLGISPTAAVCASCHDNVPAQSHMTLNGAVFGTPGDPANPPATQTDIDANVESCSVCHGPGRVSDVAVVHAN